MNISLDEGLTNKTECQQAKMWQRLHTYTLFCRQMKLETLETANKRLQFSLRQGVVKFAQVVGVFPGPKFDDAEGNEFGWGLDIFW